VFTFVVALFLSIGTTAASNVNSSEAGSDKSRKPREPVTANITIKARSDLVWLSIHEARTEDPELLSCKVIKEDGRCSTVKETFAIPVVGEATCIISLIDSPPNRIDYKLMESDTFKAFDGRWTLVPSSDGQSTRLELSCNTDLKIGVPQFLLRMVAARKIGKRLDFVKTLAEKKELQMSATAVQIK